MASGGARSLLAFWIGGASSTAGAPVVVTARPVGIPDQPWRVPATIRGRGAVELSGLVAYGRGRVAKPKPKPKRADPPKPQPIRGRGKAVLALDLVLAGTGHVLTNVTGAGLFALPLGAKGRGEHHPFHDDQLALIAAFALI